MVEIAAVEAVVEIAAAEAVVGIAAAFVFALLRHRQNLLGRRHIDYRHQVPHCMM